jgi:hypothetical protein
MGEIDKKAQATPPAAEGSSKKRWENRKKKKQGGGQSNRPPAQNEKFVGGKDELDGNYFDCSGYGQSNRFMKTVQKIADHIGQEYKGGGVTRTEVMTQTKIILPTPVRPVSVTTVTDGTTTVRPPDAMDVSDYQSAKKILDYKVQNQDDNRQKIFSLVWQQCTEALHAKIKAHRGYTTMEQDLDGIELLRVIKLICFNIEDEKYAPQKVHETKAAFYALRQGRDSDQAYQLKFMNTVEVIEQCGASLGEDPLTRVLACKNLGYDANSTTDLENEEITKLVRDYTLGTALILGADPDRYSGMIRGLKNASLAGRDEWPKNVTEAYNYLSKWEGDEVNHRAPRDHEALQFTSDGAPNERKPQPWHLKMTCRNCDKEGHIAYFCKAAKKATSNVQDGEVKEDADQHLMDAMSENCNEEYYADLFLCEDEEHRSASFFKDGINGGRIPKDWILLDSQSTTDAFSNPALLKNIHTVQGSLTIHTQAGKTVTKMRGTLPGYGEVWFCENGIANILSLANVAKIRPVSYNSDRGNQFEVIKRNGDKTIFKQSEHGLYYFQMGSDKSEV